MLRNFRVFLGPEHLHDRCAQISRRVIAESKCTHKQVGRPAIRQQTPWSPQISFMSSGQREFGCRHCATDAIIIYTVSQKTRRQTLGHNFTNYYPIFEIFSLADSVVNKFATNLCLIFHHALNMSLHYLVKYKCRKMASFSNTYCN